MSWRERSDLGHSLVADVHEALRIDDHWLLERPNGFTWWASDFAQSVWCDMGLYHNGVATYRVHAETDLLRGRGRPHHYENAIETEMDACSFSSVIYDVSEDTFKLHTSLFATEDNVAWLKRTFLAAVALQVCEAHQLGHHLAKVVGGVPASSAHPTAGIRTKPDACLDVVPRYFGPMGSQPSRWQGATEWLETERAMEREALRFWTDHQSKLHAEFAWEAGGMPGDVMLLQVDAHEPSSVMGNGLHFTLTMPLRMPPERVARMALEMNSLERQEWHRCHTLGSWCNHHGLLAHRIFLPNTVYNPELLPNLVLSMAVRAQWANEFFVAKRAAAQAAHATPAAPVAEAAVDPITPAASAPGAVGNASSGDACEAKPA